MAEFQPWERQVLPQARLVQPEGGNSLADAFGAGLQDLGKTVSSVGEKISKADAIVQQRNDAATVAKKKPEAALAYGQIYDDAVANAPEGAAGFSDTVLKATTDYNNKMLDGLSPGARTSMEEYLGLLQADALKNAHSYQAAADLAKRSRDATDAANNWINSAFKNPDDLPEIKKQIHAFVAGQSLDANAAAPLEHDLVTETTVAAMRGEAANDPERFLANAEAGKWNEVAPDRLSEAKGQAKALLQVRKTQAAAEQANRIAGLRARVDQVVQLFKSGHDFAGYDALAGELKAAGQGELLQYLDNWKGDLDYSRTVKTMTPDALKAEAEKNDQLAESTKDPIEASMYARHAEIASAAQDLLSKALNEDSLQVAVENKVAPETDVITPLFNGSFTDFRKAVDDRQLARTLTRNYYGGLVPFFSAGERQKFMAAYNGAATAEEKTKILEKIAALPGDVSAEIAGELKSLPGGGDIPMYLGFLSENGNLGHGIIFGAEVLKRYPDMLPDKDRLKAELDRQFGNLMAENPDAQIALREATTDYYAALLHSKRGEHGGALDVNLLNQAFDQVTGGAFRFENGDNPAQVIIPPRPHMTLSQFEKLVFRIDDNFLINQSARAAPGPGPGRRGPVFKGNRPVTATDIKREGSFVTVGPGLYRVLVRGEPVRDAQTGNFFVLDLKPLLDEPEQK